MDPCPHSKSVIALGSACSVSKGVEAAKHLQAFECCGCAHACAATYAVLGYADLYGDEARSPV